MAKIERPELDQIIDYAIDAMGELESIEIRLKGVRNEIEEMTAKLFFHSKLDTLNESKRKRKQTKK